jgi:lipopolysaccharide transport system permease protein
MSFSPLKMVRDLWLHRGLTRELIKRELNQRYRGSYLGLAWAVVNPLVMLLVYTFVFSIFLKVRWQVAGVDTPTQEFALIIFAGLIPFTAFSEVLNKSTALIVSIPNYVKKVVFPLQIYPVVLFGAAFITSLISVCLVLIGNLVLMRTLSKTIYLLPLAYLPLIFLCLGLGWFFASLGVYVRDIAQAMPVVTQILLFMSTIFYPASAVPRSIKFLFDLNPLTTIVDCFRQVLLWGNPLPWASWGIWTVITAILALAGYYWFMSTKKGFADIL